MESIWHLVCSPNTSSFLTRFILKQHHKCFQEGRHKENIFSEPNVAENTIVNLGFPFLWGLFLYSESEMAIFPVSVMRK